MPGISLKIRNITKENFMKYGTVLEHANVKDGYEPLVNVSSRGWIWAVMTFSNKTIDRIEAHPTSKESFEPVFGTTIIVLAPPDDRDNMEAFLLDKAVLLNEGVWHNILSLSEVARVKITENNDVTGIDYFLKAAVETAVVY